MVEIKCQKLSGLGAASKAFELQREQLVSSFSEISNCHNGTINICLACNLIVLNPHYRTNSIKWSDAMSSGEVFDFLRVKLFIPRLNQEHKAWLYIPHNSLHRKTLNIHEIICEYIDQINSCEEMIIKIENNAVQLPYVPGNIFIV